jgi:segregation and condensation protein A
MTADKPDAPGELAFADFDAANYEGEGAALILNIEGYEGPLHVLLALARDQKVDLAQISILALVDQYLKFINSARKLKLEIAADYLVMAAWLTYLKSRLLLPAAEDEEEPSAQELANRLQLRLQRLEAMREAGMRLMGRNRLGRDVFQRGAPEGTRLVRKVIHLATYYEFLKAYSDVRVRAAAGTLTIKKRDVFSLEAALMRLSSLIGTALSWTKLQDFLPEGMESAFLRRSATASMFTASLELTRTGKAELKQLEPFGDLYVKARSGRA